MNWLPIVKVLRAGHTKVCMSHVVFVERLPETGLQTATEDREIRIEDEY